MILGGTEVNPIDRLLTAMPLNSSDPFILLQYEFHCMEPKHLVETMLRAFHILLTLVGVVGDLKAHYCFVGEEHLDVFNFVWAMLN